MPVKLFEPPALDRRRYCECCGFPTLFVADDIDGRPDWQMSTSACDLCEWVSRPLNEAGEPIEVSDEEHNDGLTLTQARANVARNGTIYDPRDLPVWKVAPPAPDVVSARTMLRRAYEGVETESISALWERWAAVTEAERALRDALAAQQGADEASVAGEWDDADSAS